MWSACVYRQVQRFSQDLGEKAPNYGTIFNIVRALPVDLVTLADDGTKAYNKTFELLHRRSRRTECDLAGRPHRSILGVLGSNGAENQFKGAH
jgi:hypothetical protein